MRPGILFALGWGFYAIAELAALMDGIGVWQILYPQAIAPLWILPYETMFAKPFFIMAAVPALGFLFLGINYQPKLTRLQQSGLSFLATWTMLFAIPDMIFPLGDIYYETLKYYFGLLSLLMAFVTVTLFLVWGLAIGRKPD